MNKPPQPKESDGPHDNPWCEACKEDFCSVSLDGTCSMIRRYLKAYKEELDKPNEMREENNLDFVVCPFCNGECVVDSGGTTPWDTPINIPCTCCEGKGKCTKQTLRDIGAVGI